MTKSIVNLTVPLVIAEIERVLESYPHHPHQQVFANPDLRQELIAYVLTQIHSVYTVVDEEGRIASDMWTNPDTTDPQFYFESFIHEGIDSILKRHQALTEQLEAEADNGLSASHWFG